MRGAIFILAVLGLIVLAIQVLPAAAANNCFPRNALVERLASKYGETQSAVGQVSGNVVVEVFISASGTWSMLATTADGQSCLLISGRGWTAVPQNFDPES